MRKQFKRQQYFLVISFLNGVWQFSLLNVLTSILVSYKRQLLIFKKIIKEYISNWPLVTHFSPVLGFQSNAFLAQFAFYHIRKWEQNVGISQASIFEPRFYISGESNQVNTFTYPGHNILYLIFTFNFRRIQTNVFNYSGHKRPHLIPVSCYAQIQCEIHLILAFQKLNKYNLEIDQMNKHLDVHKDACYIRINLNRRFLGYKRPIGHHYIHSLMWS